LIEAHHPRIPVLRQCDLVGLSRSSLYYVRCADDIYNEHLMRLIDEQYTRTPFYGVRRMTAQLRRRGDHVNPKRVRRLMRLMGLEAIYPKRRLSASEGECRKYPYLLAGVKIERPDHVWSADITYIGMQRGFGYLVAILDWFSRYVLSWRLWTSLEADFCVWALQEALSMGAPEIFNTDQGCQFTSEAFTGVLKAGGIRISMDGRGRVFDNIFVERLWRSVKYEEVYLKDYLNVLEARTSLAEYFAFYNGQRPHQALDYQTPAEVYFRRQGLQGEQGIADGALAATPVALRAPSVAAMSGA